MLHFVNKIAGVYVYSLPSLWHTPKRRQQKFSEFVIIKTKLNIIILSNRLLSSNLLALMLGFRRFLREEVVVTSISRCHA